MNYVDDVFDMCKLCDCLVMFDDVGFHNYFDDVWMSMCCNFHVYFIQVD